MSDLESYKRLAAKYLREKEHFEELHRTARIEADGYWTCLEQKQVEIDKLIKQRTELYEACKAEEEARSFVGGVSVQRQLYNKAAALREAALAKAEEKQ